MNAKAISENVSATGCGKPFLILFGAIFLIFGTGFFWFAFLSPLLKSNAARKWPQTPCVIVSSTVKTHFDSDGDSYSPDIRFRYSLDGAEFESQRYSFFNHSAGQRWAQEIVEQYPPGSASVCFYDPKHPDQAVLNTALGRSYLFGLFSLLFVLIGAGIISYAILGMRHSKGTRRVAGQVRALNVDPLAGQDDSASFEGPQKLKPVESRLAKAIGVGIFTLIWNGIVSIFVANLISGAGWFQFIFLVPFVLAGIFLIVATIYQVMALANPKVEVALTNGAVPLGQSIDVAWQLSGKIGRIRKLSVIVEGTEQATYTRGTSTYTDKSVFETIELFSGTDRQELEFGTRTLQIPGETMHTFVGAKNKIAWTVKVHGEIPWWPDIVESFEFFVKPMA